MEYREVFRDVDLKGEFLDRFSELETQARRLTSVGAGGFEGLDSIRYTVDDADDAVSAMQEGTWDGGSAPGLEAIIERFTRPVYLVQDATFGPPPDDFDDSEFVANRLENARTQVNRAIPSTGRIDLRNHRSAWVGTGWIVAPNVVATNRHVASEFAKRDADGFAFQTNFNKKLVEATLDFRQEHDRDVEARFRVRKVLWIEPDSSFDVALLEIVDVGAQGEQQPAVLDLLPRDETAAAGQRWIGVIGYPARDSRNDFADQQRIFDGIYNVKRLSPGKVTAVRGDGLLEHDATTLGGSSGSAVVDLETGKVLALHFGGIEGNDNFAVQATHIADIVDRHA
jgi:endonuclease G